MSHQALQRTLVRLLHDPTLVERLRESGPTALDEPELTENERGWLAATDPRAFQTDPYRQGRILTSLVEELPTAAALAARRLEGGLTSFFSSEHFHQAVRQDRALRLAFAELLEQTGSDTRALVAIERGLMQARRAESPLEGEIYPAHGVLWISTPAGALELYEALWAGLSRTGMPVVESVLRVAQAPLPVTTLDNDDRRTLLIEPDETGGFRVGEIPSGLEAILRAARDHRSLRACEEAAVRSGADATEAQEIIADLTSEGLLVCKVG